MARPRINFDQQAGAPLASKVLAAMLPFLHSNFGNPSSLHQEGLKARDAIEDAREKVLKFVGGAGNGEVIFTSSGTEALNLGVKGSAWANQEYGKEILLSETEHPGILSSAEMFREHGFSIVKIPVDNEGRISPEAVAERISDQTTFVCVQHANQDIGTIQRIEEIAAICNGKGKQLLIDATGSAGWVPFNVAKWGNVLVALSARSFGGPKGIGALYKHRRARITPMITGGGQENGYRAGTENLPGIIGMGAAAEEVSGVIKDRAEKTRVIQRALWDGIKTQVNEVKLFGPEPGRERLPNQLNIGIAHVEGEGVALSMDMKGVAIGSGAACATNSMRIPPTLAAIGAEEIYAKGNVILSFGHYSTLDEVGHCLEVFKRVVSNLREMSPS
ncbi:MAG: cysteine desulfurase family protein [Verrucomicrobiales bacterium]